VKIVKEIYNYNEYHYKQKPDIPDTFRLELPLILDRSTNYFCVQARINGQHEECFIIDTKADISLYKVDELKKIDSHYWGDFPIKSINSRNQRFYPKLYAFNNFEIASLSFGKSLFDAIDTLDAIYNIMNKNVIGVNIQKLVNWKFDLDNDKLVILGDDISNDTDGYTKIKKGLDWNKLDMSFPEAECSGSFTLDLGASSEVLVDKKLFEALKKIYSYKTVINKSNDTIYLFNNIAVKWYNVHISNCLVMHKPYFNRNIIGATFMRYFNFILNYRKPNKDVSYKDLYFKKVKDFDRIKPYTPFSEFGFNLEKKNDNVTIKSLEINGIAYKAGLKKIGRASCRERVCDSVV
jgi:hypothetical protein